MGELLNQFKKKFTSTKLNDMEELQKVKVRNSIYSLCEEYLHEVGDIFTFEVSDKDLPYAVSIINDDSIVTSKYDIVQISKSLFEASLKEIDL